MSKQHKVLAVPDLHEPFSHPDAYAFLKAIKDKEKPDTIVCLGDEVDFHALGNWDHDPDGLSPGQELTAALNGLERLKKLFPKMYICTSNHTARPFRRAFKYGIPKAFIRDYKEFLNAPKGWEWADRWEFDDVIYEHGEGVSGRNGAIKAAEGNMRCTVIGHIHSFAGIQYLANSEHLIFGFNAGCLIDKDTYAFAYGKNIKSKPILGVGIIDKGVPKFIPMVLNKNGRWVGKL